MVRVPRETLDQAKGVAASLKGVSAGQVLAQALSLQLLIVATLDELGLTGEGLNLTAHGLLSSYTDAIISRRLDVSALSNRLAENIEAEIQERAHKLAEAAVPHHVAAALKLLGVQADVAEDGQLNLGGPPDRLIEA